MVAFSSFFAADLGLAVESGAIGAAEAAASMSTSTNRVQRIVYFGAPTFSGGRATCCVCSV